MTPLDWSLIFYQVGIGIAATFIAIGISLFVGHCCYAVLDHYEMLYSNENWKFADYFILGLIFISLLVFLFVFFRSVGQAVTLILLPLETTS